MAFVPLFCFAIFLLIYAAFWDSREDLAPRWRASFLSAALTWGVAVTGITELLSLFRLIRFDWLAAAWIALLSISVLICVSMITPNTLLTTWQFPRLPRTEFWLLLAVGGIVSTLGLIAFAAPPNNADSMTYHMPRVMHWMQNNSVEHYPTNILRQLFRPPWAGFAILQFQVLSGGDHWANFVQWFSMLGSVIGVSLIAQQLGADARGQVLAAVIAATIPMGIHQASSTQNDYVTAFWLVCLVHFILRFKILPSPANTLGIGASLALGLLTKGTTYLYAAPLLAWFSLSALKTLRLQAWRPLFAVAAIAVIINMGHFARNFELWGNPLVVDIDAPFLNKGLTPPAIMSNVVRNASLHIGTPIDRVNGWIFSGIHSLHSLLGIDISDPSTTANGKKFYQNRFRSNDDSAGNPVHLALIFGVLVLILLRKIQSPSIATYALSLVLGFVLFCSYLSWNPYHSRLHLPIFVLWCPIIAIALWTPIINRLVFAVSALLISTSVVHVMADESRPIIRTRLDDSVFIADRVDLTLNRFSRIKTAYLGAVQQLRAQKCLQVGLDLGEYGVEYPFWVLTRQLNTDSILIEHVNVRNLSLAKAVNKPYSEFSPCAVISARWDGLQEPVSEGPIYKRSWSGGPVQLFVKRALTSPDSRAVRK